MLMAANKNSSTTTPIAVSVMMISAAVYADTPRVDSIIAVVSVGYR